ncbi:TPA: hypothetical protein HA297_06650 [Candidatus Woesearchaeota archaeon]|nr:hypothetical protein [Candidatus Woesearchaeota archaeon]HII89264.1 hypothetical protein [Candidatus Woesearchaeota archaeon]
MTMARSALKTGRMEAGYYSMTQPGSLKGLRPEEGEVRLVSLDNLAELNSTLARDIEEQRERQCFPWFDTQGRDSQRVYFDANDVTAHFFDRQGRVRTNSDFQALWSILATSTTIPVANRVGWHYHPAKALNDTGRPTHLGLMLNGSANGNPFQLTAPLQEPRETISPFVIILATQVYEWWKEGGYIQHNTQHGQYYVRVGAKEQEGDFKERYVGLERRVSVGAAALASGLLDGHTTKLEHAAMKRIRRFETEDDPAKRYFQPERREMKVEGRRSRLAGMTAIGTLYLSLIAPIGRKGGEEIVGASVVSLHDAAALLFHADVEYVGRAFEEVGLRPFAGIVYRPEDVRKRLITPVMDAEVKMYLQPVR